MNRECRDAKVNSPAKGRTFKNGSTNLGKLYGLIISC